VEPPLHNVQRCYEHVDDEELGTSSVNPGVERSRADENPEQPPSKRRQVVQIWLDDEAEEDASAYMLNPRKKRSEQARAGGSAVPVQGPQEGQTPPVEATTTVRVVEKQTRPPPQDGGQSPSAQHTSQAQPRRRAFTTVHQSSDL
jgi:hypothetical protein